MKKLIEGVRNGVIGHSPDYTGTADSVKITTHGCRGSIKDGVLYINPTSTWDVRTTEEAVTG